MVRPVVRALVFVCAVVVAACHGSSPARPSASGAIDPLPQGSVAINQGLLGASALDLAACLSGSQDAGCFSGPRLAIRVVSAAAPAAPTNLTSSVSGSTVTLTWAAGGGDAPTTYVLEAGSASGLANLANAPTGSTATSFVATGIGAGTYYVRVRAQNASGTSAASNETVVVVGSAACTSAPNAPAGLTNAVSGSTISLSWTAPSGGCAPTSYVLQAGTSSGSSNLANASTGNTLTTYTAPGVGDGTYYVRVRAQNAFGQSAASNETVVTVNNTALFSRSGRNGTTFTTPSTVRLVRITAQYVGSLAFFPCDNFGVAVGGRPIVNEILGFCSLATVRTIDTTVAPRDAFGTYGGITSICNGSGGCADSSWTFTEVR